jgi:hypothetical protein
MGLQHTAQPPGLDVSQCKLECIFLIAAWHVFCDRCSPHDSDITRPIGIIKVNRVRSHRSTRVRYRSIVIYRYLGIVHGLFRGV